MGLIRVELTGFTDGDARSPEGATACFARSSPGSCACSCRPARPVLRSWRKLMERYPLARIADRAACVSMPCRRMPPTWPTASRAMPRRCAATISPTAIARAATGWSAMSPTRRGRSLFVRLSGPDHGKGAAGKWTDAATGEHGDLLDLIAREPRSRSTCATSLEEARAFLSLPPTRARRPDRLSSATRFRRLTGIRTPSVRHVAADRRHARGDLSARPRHR